MHANDGDATAIEGDRSVALPEDLSQTTEYEPITVDPEMTCSDTGDIPGPWTGLALGELLAAADPPAETTHVLVECRDGFRACIEVVEALDAVVAYRRDGESLGPDGLRLVGPDIGSTRSAKGVARIEPVALTGDDDPSDLEVLDPSNEADA